MKKHIAQEIQQLAKKLLILEGDFNTEQLKKTLGALYEKVVVLSYLESQEHPSQVQKQASLDSKSYREENWFKEPEPVPQSAHEEDLVEPLIEKIKDIVAQMPAETQRIDALLEEVLPQKKYVKNDLEDFASQYQQMPTFERKKEPETSLPKSSHKKSTSPVENKLVTEQDSTEKPKSINDIANKSLKVGLNDRLAFVKYLFDNNTDDFQRVLSQINTFENFPEARDFIEQHVKPEYSTWDDKEEVATRFMTLVEKRFH